MISTMDLFRWHQKIEETKAEAEELAQEYALTQAMADYYMHLVHVADAQLSLVERLIRESEIDDGLPEERKGE